MNLATASSSSSQRKIVLFMWSRQGGLDFQAKRKRNTQFFVVTNLELKRTILHHFVTIFVTEDQKR